MVEVIGTQRDALGECPLWDARIGHLYSIDIDGRRVHRLDPATGTSETRSLDGRPGSIALTEDTDVLLVAVETRLVWLDWPSGSVRRGIGIPTGGVANRLNDGAADRSGRFWVGSMHEQATEWTGLLCRVDVDATVEVTDRGLGVPNGIAFSPDGAVMYVADTLSKTVWAHPYDPATGERRTGEVLTDFSQLPGAPDGATVDADGCYWIACIFGSAVARLTPAGRVDRIVRLPVDKPTKCAFGGASLDVLFVTSIGGGASHPTPDPPGDDGLLLAVDVGVTGVPEPIVAIR
jgi:sugar lactone lactonase YvrE